MAMPSGAARDPARRPLVYLVATSGYPNYGDELITATWLRLLARVAPDCEVWVDCPAPGPSEVLLSALHPRVHFTDTLWRLCWESPDDSPWQVSSFVRHAIADPGRAPRWVAGIELAARADIVHVVGGGYINAIWPRHIGLLAGAVAAVRRSGGRAVMTGQGLWPVAPEARPLVRNLAAQFSVVDVRDEPSASLFDGMHTQCTGDDLFFGIQPGLFRSDDLREVVVCVQSDLLDVTVPALAGFLLDTLRSWQVRPADVGIVEGIPRADREVYALIEHDLAGARFYPFSEIMDRGLPAVRGQRWLSSRFHMHMMAAAAGADGVAVSVNSAYYTNKHRSLIQCGSGWSLNEGLTPPDVPSGGGFAPSTLAMLHDRKAELAASIYG